APVYQGPAAAPPRAPAQVAPAPLPTPAPAPVMPASVAYASGSAAAPVPPQSPSRGWRLPWSMVLFGFVLSYLAGAGTVGWFTKDPLLPKLMPSLQTTKEGTPPPKETKEGPATPKENTPPPAPAPVPEKTPDEKEK